MAVAKWWMPSPTAKKRLWAFIRCWKPHREGGLMPDLSINFCGVRSPNPFWLASGPPANTSYQVMRAFDAGWGGAVWKTIGEPIMGLNNIELISDRPVEVNLREITEVKKRFPKHTVVASLMVESKRESWHDIV